MEKSPHSLFLTATAPPSPPPTFLVLCCLLLSLLFVSGWLTFFINGVNRMDGQTENKRDLVARKYFATKDEKDKIIVPSQPVKERTRNERDFGVVVHVLQRQPVCMCT